MRFAVPFEEEGAAFVMRPLLELNIPLVQLVTVCGHETIKPSASEMRGLGSQEVRTTSRRPHETANPRDRKIGVKETLGGYDWGDGTERRGIGDVAAGVEQKQ